MVEIQAISMELRQLGYKYLRATEKAEKAQKRIADIEMAGIESRQASLSAEASVQIYRDIYEPYSLFQEILAKIRKDGYTQEQVGVFWSALREAGPLGAEAQERILLLRPSK